MLHNRCFTGFWICLGFQFWVYRGSEDAGVTQGSEYTWIISEHGWICLNVLKYVWMCLNLSEWILFYFPTVIPFLLEQLVTYFIVSALNKSYSIVWGIMRLFSWREFLICSVAAGSTWFVFCFQQNISTRLQITFFN